MSEISVEPEKSKQEIFRQRDLPGGGTLFILEQSHRTSYPRAEIEQDIREISPHVLIIENTTPVGPALYAGESFADDVKHQLSLARELNIPVIFPDISGVITPEDSLVDTNYWSVFTDTSRKIESASPASVPAKPDMTSAISLGSTFMAITLGARNMVGVEIGLKNEKKFVIKNPRQISRRDFLKIAGLATAAVTIPLAVPRISSVPDIKSVGKEMVDLTAPSSDNDGTRKEMQVATTLANSVGDQEKLESFVYGLRNAKFISIAEQVAEKLSNKPKIKEPKVALIVGQGHGPYLSNPSRNADAKSRSLAAEKGIAEVFLPTYHWLISSIAKDNETLLAVENRALLDLVHITVAGVYQVASEDFTSSEKSTKPMGYLISKEIQQGVETALRSEPGLLATYKKKMSELEKYTY